jgi:hypothetical protein
VHSGHELADGRHRHRDDQTEHDGEPADGAEVGRLVVGVVVRREEPGGRSSPLIRLLDRMIAKYATEAAAMTTTVMAARFAGSSASDTWPSMISTALPNSTRSEPATRSASQAPTTQGPECPWVPEESRLVPDIRIRAHGGCGTASREGGRPGTLTSGSAEPPGRVVEKSRHSVNG